MAKTPRIVESRKVTRAVSTSTTGWRAPWWRSAAPGRCHDPAAKVFSPPLGG